MGPRLASALWLAALSTLAACADPASGPGDEAELEGEAGDSGDDLQGTGGFIRLDSDPARPACNVWDPQCPQGHKCAPSASGDDLVLDGFHCVPIMGEGLPGDPCEVFGEHLASGLDDCERGSWCHSVDDESRQGTCLAHCSGSRLSPWCPLATDCLLSSHGTPAVCVNDCHPWDRPCDGDLVCVPFADGGWVCAHSASGGAGPHGTPCQYANTCDPGGVCAPLPIIGTTCDGSQNCCAQLCQLDGPNECPGAAEGEVCSPYYSHLPTPPGYEDVGYCTRLP